MQIRRLFIAITAGIWLHLAASCSSAQAQETCLHQAPQSPPAKEGEIPRQQENKTSQEQECWNLFYQATSIGSYHGTFHSPYEGPFSLRDYPERDVSLTTTLFFGLRIGQNTQFYFDPEVAGGRGFSGVTDLPISQTESFHA